MFGTCGSLGESVPKKIQETFWKIDLLKWVVFFHVYRPRGPGTDCWSWKSSSRSFSFTFTSPYLGSWVTQQGGIARRVWYCWWFRNLGNKLRLVVFPILYRVLYILGFLNQQQYHTVSHWRIPKVVHRSMSWTTYWVFPSQQTVSEKFLKAFQGCI